MANTINSISKQRIIVIYVISEINKSRRYRQTKQKIFKTIKEARGLEHLINNRLFNLLDRISTYQISIRFSLYLSLSHSTLSISLSLSLFSLSRSGDINSETNQKREQCQRAHRINEYYLTKYTTRWCFELVALTSIRYS